MARWKVTERLETDIPDVTEVVVRIVGGEVAVTAGAEPRLEVERRGGPEVEVTYEVGVLRISQPEPSSSGFSGFVNRLFSGRPAGEPFIGCSVALTVPPSTLVDVATVSAPVIASGLARRTRLKTVSGAVTLSDLSDEVDVKTVSGSVEARGLSADLKAKTVSGSVSVADSGCRWVEAKSISGDVILDLDLDPRGVYSFTTVSGLVAVRTDGDPSVLVEATTVSGDVVSDFELDWSDDRPGRRRLRQSIGEGEARLVVKTVSGDLRLLKRRVAA